MIVYYERNLSHLEQGNKSTTILKEIVGSYNSKSNILFVLRFVHKKQLLRRFVILKKEKVGYGIVGLYNLIGS